MSNDFRISASLKRLLYNRLHYAHTHKQLYIDAYRLMFQSIQAHICFICIYNVTNENHKKRVAFVQPSLIITQLTIYGDNATTFLFRGGGNSAVFFFFFFRMHKSFCATASTPPPFQYIIVADKTPLHTHPKSVLYTWTQHNTHTKNDVITWWKEKLIEILKRMLSFYVNALQHRRRRKREREKLINVA